MTSPSAIPREGALLRRRDLRPAFRKVLVPYALAASLVVIAAGCQAQDPARFVSILDELRVPQSWEVVTTMIHSTDSADGCTPGVIACPWVARYFLTEQTPAEAQPDAKEALIQTGFKIDEEVAPECDLPPGGAACSLIASRAPDMIQLSLYSPGIDPDNVGVSDPERSLIRVIAQPN